MANATLVADFPEFDITIHPNGRATILMDGEPVKWTRGVQIHQRVGEFPEIAISYIAEEVRLHGLARHVAIIQPLAFSHDERLTPVDQGIRVQQSTPNQHVWITTPADWDKAEYSAFTTNLPESMPEGVRVTVLPPGVTVTISSLPEEEVFNEPRAK